MHPTPQFRRQHWLDLNGEWGFAYDDADIGLDEGWPDQAAPFGRTIVVPFPPESAASGIGDPTEHPVVWYRRTFRLDQVEGHGRGRRLIVHFGAVDYEARIWVNGRLVGSHEGGHASFALDVTEALRPDGDQVLVVRALDRPSDLSQPRGKQFWEHRPRQIWYHRTTGIWQPVWLEAVGPIHLDEVRWTPDLGREVVGLQIRLSREPVQPLRLRLRLSLGGRPIADDSYLVQGRETHREVGFEPVVLDIGRRKLLWSPDHPNLVDALLVLETSDGQPLDEVHSYVGLRSVAAEDGLFFLNGMPSYLRLVLAQGYWPESLLAAPSEAAIVREVAAVKALGFNGVRIHQKVEDPRFLYECDRQGLFVWSEMAAAYAFSDVAVERFTREWLEVLRRDYSHPSIVAWVPFNESWGLPNLAGDDAQRSLVRAIYNLTKAVDRTRPVIGNDGWEHIAADIWGIHDYALEAATLRERYGTPAAVENTLGGRPGYHRVQLDGVVHAGQPIVLSEFGGITYEPEAGKDWFGYRSVPDRDAFLAVYRELTDAVLDSPGLAGFCYTQLTDTEQETNGLLDAAREPKLDPAEVARITSRPSAAIPGDAVAAVQGAGMLTASGGGTGSGEARGC